MHAGKTNSKSNNVTFSIQKIGKMLNTVIIHSSKKNLKETAKTSGEHFKMLSQTKVATLIVTHDKTGTTALR